MSTTDIWGCSRQINAAKYFAQLCASTCYSCEADKLSALVLLAHLACLIDDKAGLVDDEYICANATGLHIASFNTSPFLPRFYNPNDKIQQIKDFRKIPNTSFKLCYQYDKTKIEDVKDVLYQIFLSFGAYPREILNEITTHTSMYPKIDFWTFPGGSLLLPHHTVSEYIRRLTQAYNKCADGVDVIQSLVSDILSDIDEKKG